MSFGFGLISKTLKSCKFIKQDFSKCLLSSLAVHHLPFQRNVFIPVANSLQNFSLANRPWLNLSKFSSLVNGCFSQNSVTPKPLIPVTPITVPTRSRKDITIIKWDMKSGTRLTNIDVIKRFKRLDWGIWIRPRAGATRMLWKKKLKRVNRLQQNVFCSAKQCRRLDKMVTSFWRTPRVYADDPYAPYMKRDDFWLTRGEPPKYN